MNHPARALAIFAASTLGAAISPGVANGVHGVQPTRLGQLTAAQLAGQRIVYSYAGQTPPAALLRLIRDGEAAGVFLSSWNIASPAALRTVIGELQRANGESPVHAPLLIMLDQEGGLVRRLPGEPVLSEQQIGSARDALQLAAYAGREAGENLLSAGVTVNLAPVVDVFREAGDFIDRYGRSYSSSAPLVAKLAAEFIGAQQATGVAATAKHFPGLGAATTDQDTDRGPVTLPLSLPAIRTEDELPYRAAIAAGVKLVMSSWALYPALDPRSPAGLSSSIIHGELRGRLRFRGVTITDALGAGAIATYGGFARRAVLAAHAGEDLLLCTTGTNDTTTLTSGISALHGLTEALVAHRLDHRYAEGAAERIIELREHP